jgi:RHS repeat-associated protein
VTQGSIVRTISYTADGNTLQDNFGTGAVFSYAYSNDNRLVQASLSGVTQASYTLNYLGQRVIKSAVTSGTTDFHYDRFGHLIAESDGSGNVLREYVFLGDTPVAFVTPTGGIDIIHTDHLGTPQKMTDATQAVVWDGGASDPFMMSALPPTPAMGLRFPGQYFDGETSLQYNYFRDYDPSLGRYTESDPIGIDGGVNTFAYVGADPIRYLDSLGLQEEDLPAPDLDREIERNREALEPPPAPESKPPSCTIENPTGGPQFANPYSTRDARGGPKGINTNVTPDDFIKNLQSNGYVASSRAGDNGPVTVLQNDSGSTWTVYTRNSTGESGAQYVGPNGQFLKFNLGK